MEEKWLTAEVTNIANETENTKRFFFSVREKESFPFKPGQFITFDLPIHEQKGKRMRSYTIASPPDGNKFELIIVQAPLGAASKYLWHEVHSGSALTFRGPLGKFILPEVIDTDICLVATGTGIAPFRSMLLDLIHNPRPTKNLYLVFGTRFYKDILYRQELEELQNKIPDFKYLVTLSREESPDYTGHKGHVHQLYEELFADKRPAHFYLCGWHKMVDEARTRIAAMGYDRKTVHLELYD